MQGRILFAYLRITSKKAKLKKIDGQPNIDKSRVAAQKIFDIENVFEWLKNRILDMDIIAVLELKIEMLCFLQVPQGLLRNRHFKTHDN